jgi:5-methylcytosine-specific restriction endonuclease McrA
MADSIIADFDPSKFYLGSLCKRGHDHCGTGQSLRYKRGSCYECAAESRKANRGKQAQWRKDNAQHRADYDKEWRKRNVEHLAEYQQQRKLSKPASVPKVRKIASIDLSTVSADILTSFDPSRFRLGNLCGKGHDYCGTGLTLRGVKKGDCQVCKKLAARTPEARLKSRERNRRKRLENLEDYRVKDRERYRENRVEKVREYGKMYRKENLELIRSKKKKYHNANSEKIIAKTKKWAEENPEKSKATKVQISHRRRARMASVHHHPWTTSEQSAKFAHFGHSCAYCGATGNLTVDHFISIASGGPNTLGNIVPACPRCNSSKHASDASEWYHRQSFYDKKRWKLILKVQCVTEATAGQIPLL